MKLPASRLRSLLLLLALLLAGLERAPLFATDTPETPAVDETPPPLSASPTPPITGALPQSGASPAATPKPGKKAKVRDPNATPKPPKIKKPKDIPFPLPIGSGSQDVTIPQNDIRGQLLSQIMALKATRISNELVQLNEMKMDLYHPDGKEDFHIFLPTSVFNLQTHLITSEEAVRVQTDDFELTGEKMEFNTVDRTGKLLGRVHMVIRNLKQVAGPQPPPAAP